MMGGFYNSGLALGFQAHMFFCLLLLTGLVLFVIWAVKYLSKTALLNWTIALIVIGLLGAILTSGFGIRSMMNGFGPGNYGMHMNGQFSEELQEQMYEEMREHMGLSEKPETTENQ